MVRGYIDRHTLYRYAVKHPWITFVCLCVLLYAVVQITRKVTGLRVKTLNEYSGRLQEQSTLDYLSEKLRVHVQVVDNVHRDDNGRITLRLSLTNAGDVTISRGEWSIYLYSFSLSAPEKVACGLEVGHVNGDLYFLSPTQMFATIAPQTTMHCSLHLMYPCISRTDFMPNWYVASSVAETSARVIQSTRDESLQFVGDFDEPVKWKRDENDLYNPYTTDQRYSMHDRGDDTHRDTVTIVPTPVSVIQQSRGSVTFSRDTWVVRNSEDFPDEARFLAEKLQIQLKPSRPAHSFIYFTKEHDTDLDREWYNVAVTTDPVAIQVKARTHAGAFYGVQSVLSLVEGGNGDIPVVVIDDKPRFQYRGLMIDVARNFQSKSSILKIISTMSSYKLNRLHLHLSDDNGWRIEIPGLPELAEIGSKRCHNHENNMCINPGLGSGPDTSTSGSGYYSVADYREILRYAKKHHVTVVPEIDMPGHSRSAVLSMSIRDKKDRQNQLHDSGGHPSYNLVDDQGLGFGNWLGNTLNPCLNTTYMFVNKILDELILIHRGAQDLEMFHLGGDEVYFGVWDGSPTCRQLVGANEQISTAQLKRVFVYTVAQIAANKGLSIGAWEDGMYSEQPYSRQDFKNREVYVYPWQQDQGGRSVEFADAGYKVILAQATHLYLDHPYEPDPEERGLYWATRYTDTRRIFDFEADDIFKNADICPGGICPKRTRPENVVGLQACIWSETIRTETQLQYMAFPRLLAVAERAWHKASWEGIESQVIRDQKKQKDWERFSYALGTRELPRLEKVGVHYRVPPPGAMVVGHVLMVNTLYPGHSVEVAINGGDTWQTVERGFPLPRGDYNVSLRSRSPVLHRASRVVTMVIHNSAGVVFSFSHSFICALVSVGIAFIYR